jgi:hypothetical protein
MKTIKFVLSIVFITMLVTSMCPTNAATIERNITIEDDTGDVVNETGIEVTYDDVDIKQITCVQTGTKVDLEFKIVGGNLSTSGISLLGTLSTTSYSYLGYIIIYGPLAVAFAIEFPDFEGDILIISEFREEPLNVISESIGKTTLSFSFNLENSYERILGISAQTFSDVDLTGESSGYSDYAPNDLDEVGIGNLEINAGGDYFADAGQTIQLQGNLIEGNPTDYEWLWVFDDSLISLEGRTPTNKFNIPGDYSGLVYAYDDEGNWGSDIFTVTVNETSSNNGGSNNNQPGFELVVVIGAIAIALVILKRKK